MQFCLFFIYFYMLEKALCTRNWTMCLKGLLKKLRHNDLKAVNMLNIAAVLILKFSICLYYLAFLLFLSVPVCHCAYCLLHSVCLRAVSFVAALFLHVWGSVRQFYTCKWGSTPHGQAFVEFAKWPPWQGHSRGDSKRAWARIVHFYSLNVCFFFPFD